MREDTQVDIEDQVYLNETVNRVRGILMRRRWWILCTAAGISLATCGILFLLPNRYTSEATLLVVEQQVPVRYVVPNNTTDLRAALQAMNREVLSHTRLLKIVEDFNLYEVKRRRFPLETIAELMSKDIDIQPVDENPTRKDFTAFKISFTAENPKLAQRVASTLTSLFISENLKTREQQAVTTTTFLYGQLNQKRQALDALEKRLRDLKIKFVGELPEQQQGNLGILAGFQAQLQNVDTALSHAQEQRVYLGSLLNGYLAQATLDINQLRTKRAKLLDVYTPQYPEVVRIDHDIAKAESVLAQLSQEAPVALEKNRGGSAMPSAALTEQPAAAQVRSQLNANKLEMANLANEEVLLKAEIVKYQNRLEGTPMREQQLLAVTREVEQLRQEYAELAKKEQESELATNLEKNQGGQQFRLVDPPSLPALPSSPKRLKASLGGVAGGFAVGLMLAFLVEVKASAFHSEEDVTQRLAPPWVTAVPLILTPAEERKRAWKTAVECMAAFIILCAIAAAEFLVYRTG